MKKLLILFLIFLLVGCISPFSFDPNSVCENVEKDARDDCLLVNCPRLKTVEGREACCQTIKDDSLRKQCFDILSPEEPADITGEGPDVVDGYVTIKGTMPASLNEGESFSVYLEYIQEGGKFSELSDAMYTSCRGVGFEGKCFDSEQTNGILAKKIPVALNSWDMSYPTTEFEEKVYIGDAAQYRIIYTQVSESEDDNKLKEYKSTVEGPFSAR